MKWLKYGITTILAVNWFIILIGTFKSSDVKATDTPISVPHEEVLKTWNGPIKFEENMATNEEIIENTDTEIENNEHINEGTNEDSIDESIENKDTDTQLTNDNESNISEEILNANNEISEIEDIVFYHKEISETLINKMEEITPIDNKVISYDELRHVVVTHWGFDGKTHQGNLIVNTEVADEIVEIFKEVFEANYQIAKMKLMIEYNNDDKTSMADNNTSAFNFREVTNSSELSAHAYGLAIDINPQMNPYISSDYILPSNATLYAERSELRLGMIVEGDALHNAFITRGWSWGGDWTDVKDYQHFSKVNFE